VQELVFTLEYDDRGEITDAFEGGLRPSVTLAFEMDGQRDAIVSGGSTGAYLGIGVEPSFKIGEIDEGDLTLSLPATLGLGLWDYYERATGGDNDFFGYLQVGGVLTMPLRFFPKSMGPWDGHVGLHWLMLGDNNEERNDRDWSELIFEFGFTTEF
jgi:hypothetical protein